MYYITSRKLTPALALKAVHLCHNTLTIGTVDLAVITRALSLSGQDFEDNVVIACAERENLDAIITRNHKAFQHSSIAVYAPSAWLAFVA